MSQKRNRAQSRAKRNDQHAPKPGVDHVEDAPKVERVLAVLTVVFIAVAVLAYLATLVVSMFVDRRIMAESVGPAIVLVAYVGLPLGVVCAVTLLVLSMRRRSKELQRSRADAADRESTRP